MSQVRIFDRRLLRLRRDGAARRVADTRPILAECVDRLLDRLDDTTRRFDRALEIGGRGIVAPRLVARGIGFVVSADLSPAMAALSAAPRVAADEEWLPFAPGSFDLIVANLVLHWTNDLPGALVQLRRALTPDGLFLASLPGLGTLAPLRAALGDVESLLRGGVSPRVSPFPDLQAAAALLQRAGFALPVADQEAVGLSYRSALALLRDLRSAGETNALLAADRRVPPRQLFPRTAASLDTGALPVSADFRLLVMTGWSPHASQQQPARPGSATHSLATALGSVERKAGEVARPR